MDDISGYIIIGLICVGFGMLLMTAMFVTADTNAIRVDTKQVLTGLSNSQVNEINTYLKVNYPDNIVSLPSDEKTTIIYVYQNGTRCKT